MKLPSMQWYPGDWLRDPGVQALSYEDQGIWFAILMRMWEGEDRGKLTLNGQPMPVEALARLLGLDNQKVNQTLTTLLTYGVTSVEPDTGIIFSRRMVRDEKLRQTRKICGEKGGNPVLLNQKSKQKPTTQDKQIPTPSSSSSSSNTTPTPSFDLELAFEELWNAYPAKGRTRMPLCQQVYVGLVATLSEDQQPAAHRKILDPVLPGGKWAESAQWAKGFIQGLADYLAQKRWLENPDPSTIGRAQTAEDLEIQREGREAAELRRKHAATAGAPVTPEEAERILAQVWPANG
jgi:uncharacterized protein YdaU (DUF1376 family)